MGDEIWCKRRQQTQKKNNNKSDVCLSAHEHMSSCRVGQSHGSIWIMLHVSLDLNVHLKLWTCPLVIEFNYIITFGNFLQLTMTICFMISSWIWSLISVSIQHKRHLLWNKHASSSKDLSRVFTLYYINTCFINTSRYFMLHTDWQLHQISTLLYIFVDTHINAHWYPHTRILTQTRVQNHAPQVAFVPSICFPQWLIAISERFEGPWKNTARGETSRLMRGCIYQKTRETRYRGRGGEIWVEGGGGREDRGMTW